MQPHEQSPFFLAPPANAGRMWLASYLLRRQVVNASTLEEIGRVADVIFDAQRSALAGLSIRLNAPSQGFMASVSRALGFRRDTGVIGIEHVIALNGDVVMVSADPIRPAASQALEHMSHLNEVCELAILTSYGVCLGSLADLLLDNHGSTIMGYVVKPTPTAESLLPPLEGLDELDPPPPYVQQVPASPANTGEADTGEADTGEADTGDTPASSEPPASRWRVIPASSRIHIGDSLILLVAEVEPLERNVVVITRQSGDRLESGDAQSYQ